MPDKDQWVNLSPYEKDRIIPDNYGLTEMGRDVLAQDYMLKQISASLTNPQTVLGKKFWDAVYAKSYEKFGTTDVPTDTFNKVWIMPDKAVIFEKGSSVVVLEHHLKVMLDSDYRAMKENGAGTGEAETEGAAARISKEVMREVIIPAIEKEVNEGRNFAPLRQIHNSMLLAAWYKRALKASILNKVYGDQVKLKGIDQDPKANQEIFEKYVAAFKKGVFNMIKEDTDRFSQEVIPRKYFSGGDHASAVLFEQGKVERALESLVTSGKVRDIFSNSDNVMTVFRAPESGPGRARRTGGLSADEYKIATRFFKEKWGSLATTYDWHAFTSTMDRLLYSDKTPMRLKKLVWWYLNRGVLKEQRVEVLQELRDFINAKAGFTKDSEILAQRSRLAQKIMRHVQISAYKAYPAGQDYNSWRHEFSISFNSAEPVDLAQEDSDDQDEGSPLVKHFYMLGKRFQVLKKNWMAQPTDALEQQIRVLVSEQNEVALTLGEPYTPIHLAVELGLGVLKEEGRNSVENMSRMLFGISEIFPWKHRILPLLTEAIKLMKASKFHEAWDILAEAQMMATASYNFHGLTLGSEEMKDWFKPVETIMNVREELQRRVEEQGAVAGSANDEAILAEAADIVRRYSGEPDPYDPRNIGELESRIQGEYRNTGKALTPERRAHIKSVMERLYVNQGSIQLKATSGVSAPLRALEKARASTFDIKLEDALERVANALTLPPKRWEAYVKKLGQPLKIDSPYLAYEIVRIGIAGNAPDLTSDILIQRMDVLFGEEVSGFMFRLIDMSKGKIRMNAAAVNIAFYGVETGQEFAEAGSFQHLIMDIPLYFEMGKREAGVAVAREDFHRARAILNVLGNGLEKAGAAQEMEKLLDLFEAVNEAEADKAMDLKGGIDFAQSDLDMQIKRDGAGVPLPVSQQNLENIHIDGLVPVILDIQPASGALGV